MSAPLVKTATPGVYKRGNRYVVVFRDSRGKQRKRSARTLMEARKLKASLTTDADRGELDDSKVTFLEYAPGWIDRYNGRTDNGIKPETLVDYRRDLGPLTPEQYEEWEQKKRKLADRVRDRETLLTAFRRQAEPNESSVLQVQRQLDRARAKLKQARNQGGAVEFFGDMRLSHIRPRHIKEYAAELGQTGVSAVTVKRKLAPVKALLADALEEGVIRTNPAAGVRITTPKAQTEDRQEHKSLKQDQLRALLEATPEQWRLFFSFLADSGLRIGEAVALQWADVDPDARLVHVQRRLYRGRIDKPKSSYGNRRVRISQTVANELRTLRQARPDDALVFPNTIGTFVDPGNLMSRVLKPAAVKAGLGQWVVAGGRRHPESWVGFHTLRHTCGTLLFGNGWNAKQVQLQLGHHSPEFTLKVYIDAFAEDLPDNPGVGGNKEATRPPENDREHAPTETAETVELPRLVSSRLVAGAKS